MSDSVYNRPLIAIDFDGTLVKNAWPAMGDMNPGAVRYVQMLMRDNDCIIYSARLNNHDIYGKLRTKEEVYKETKAMRQYLDTMGLQDLKIWAGEDTKPSALIFIDDRAIHFDGSWRRVFHETRKRLGQT